MHTPCRCVPVKKRARQRGAALLLAMLVVALVAVLASAATWQQWRSSQVEAAERSRLQANWILVGALDWARLILTEDAKQGGADHLAEPWAIPLMEARLNTFLAAERNVTIDMTLTAPGCPVAGEMPEWVQNAVRAVVGINEVTVNMVFDPPWTQDRMSDEARIALDMY